ncbi:MAG: glycosyltransferase family 10 [Desulfuromonadaceae bacterium]|nr:glycosyltransferase family 10 [Desulfuromonadaceae bacterium]
MKTIKLFFSDFSRDFVIENDHFYSLLSKRYNILIDSTSPDYLIYSCYGFDHLKYDCVKIFYTAENLRPDFNLCDYAIGFDYLEFGDRYIRFPNYARYGDQFEQLENIRKVTSLTDKDRFCNFLYSNAEADPARDQFFERLSEYKKVDSAGRHRNNMGAKAGDRYDTNWRTSKIDFLKKYKFTIAFENSSSIGYTTEKIMHAFAAGSVPIYWGNPAIAKEFNKDSFVNCHDFSGFDQVISHVIQLDGNLERYLGTLNQPCFIDGKIPYELSSQCLLKFFEAIFDQPLESARRRPRYGTTIFYEEDMKIMRLGQCIKRLKNKFRAIKATIKKVLLSLFRF